MVRALDLAGLKFGRLTVVEKAGHLGKKVSWRCECECGGETVRPTCSLTSGATKSCGCLMNGTKPEGWNQRKDLTGQVFGRLTVLGPAGLVSNRAFSWRCVCECGNECAVRTSNLRSGTTQSCGCYQKDRTVERHFKHGAKSVNKPDLAITWMGMRQRCLNPNATNYYLYGGRGITICDRWLHGADGISGLECFIADMGPKPSPDHTVDRYPDNDGPYAPWNCRWATMAEQNLNKRSNGVKAPVQPVERAA